MNNGNFNASDLPNIEYILKSLENDFYQLYCAGYPEYGDHKCASDVYSLIHSEDSSLAKTWTNTNELSESIYEKAKIIIHQIILQINDYAKKTVANEQSTAKGVGDVNTSIDNSRNELDSIDV